MQGSCYFDAWQLFDMLIATLQDDVHHSHHVSNVNYAVAIYIPLLSNTDIYPNSCRYCVRVAVAEKVPSSMLVTPS